MAAHYAYPHSSGPAGLSTIVGPTRLSVMAFFVSEIVQGEAKRLFGDYQRLVRLGGEFGTFGREGK